METIEKLLKRKAGASLEELMEATKWQKHSVRGALSRLKTAGKAIESRMNGKRGRVYHEGQVQA